METRTAARELALLALFQLPKNPEKLAKTDFQAICLAAVRTLTDYAKSNINKAEAFFIQAERHLLEHQIEHPVNELKTDNLSVVEIPKTDKFVEHLDNLYQSLSLLREALKIPELYSHYQNKEVEEFALAHLTNFVNHRDEVNSLIDETSKSWDLERIRKIDKGILQLAVGEMISTDTPRPVIASEAIKIANKYSSDEGVKFINGILSDIIESLSVTD